MYVHYTHSCIRFADTYRSTYSPPAAFLNSVGPFPSSLPSSLPPHVRGSNLNVFGTLRGAYDGFKAPFSSQRLITQSPC